MLGDGRSAQTHTGHPIGAEEVWDKAVQTIRCSDEFEINPNSLRDNVDHEWVAVLGRPRSDPVISKLGRIMGRQWLGGGGVYVLWTDADLRKGFSGSPMITMDGAAVGFILGESRETAGIFGGVQFELVMDLIEEWTASVPATD